MTRKYLNDKYCVRCGRKSATPFLRKNVGVFAGKEDELIVDIGCGNGRNSEFMKENGFTDILPLDMVNDYGKKTVLGVDPLPTFNESASGILCNYLLMFLSDEEIEQLFNEINRIAAKGCVIMVELYAAKDSKQCPTAEALAFTKQTLIEDFEWNGWKIIKNNKERFIAVKEKMLHNEKN